MSTINWDNYKFYPYEIRDIMSGATIATGRVYPFERDAMADMREANSYVFRPPVELKPGMLVLIREAV